MAIYNKKAELFKKSHTVSKLRSEDRGDAVAAAEKLFEFYGGILGPKPGVNYSINGFFEEFARNKSRTAHAQDASAGAGLTILGGRATGIDPAMIARLSPEEKIVWANECKRPKESR